MAPPTKVVVLPYGASVGGTMQEGALTHGGRF